MISIPLGLATALQDRCRITRELGQGGMPTVYLAEDLKHRGFSDPSATAQRAARDGAAPTAAEPGRTAMAYAGLRHDGWPTAGRADILFPAPLTSPSPSSVKELP